jgi:hypothetical protein
VQIPDGYAPDIGHFALKSKTGKRVHIRARLINASGKLIDLGRPEPVNDFETLGGQNLKSICAD